MSKLNRIGYGCSVLLMLSVAGTLLSRDGSLSAAPPKVPLGNLASGLTLAGPLAGKRVYYLPEAVNIPHCWMDSVYWTGSELFYAIASFDFSNFLAGGVVTYDPQCALPPEQVNGKFDIYRAVVRNGQWHRTHQSFNSVEAEAGMRLSGNTLVYTVYFSPSQADLYATQMVSTGGWSPPVPLPFNSPCKDDNPELYAGGTKLIFESNRTDPTGTSCDAGDVVKLWYSQKAPGGWTQPQLLQGAPNVGDKNTQPWVDEAQGYLYWTADSSCACIRRMPFDGQTVSGQPEDLITPNPFSLVNGTADGQVVFVGEYSYANGHVFFGCARAQAGGPILNQWSIFIDVCAIPL